MANYYRITAYHPGEDYSFIVDSHGKFEKLWEFSSYLVNKGVKVLEFAHGDSQPGSLVQGCVVVREDFAAENAAAVNTFLDGNMRRAKEHPEYLYIQSAQRGQPTRTTVTVDGKSYRAIEICGRRYVPDREKVVR